MRRTQRIYAIARPAVGVTYADMSPVMQQEAARVWALYERGVLREAYVRTDALGAVYVLESDEHEARALLDEQPMVRDGLAAFEHVPTGPFLPLADLFGTQAAPVPPARLGPVSGRTQRVVAVSVMSPGMTRDHLVLHGAEEARQAWALTKAGVLRESGLRTDRAGAVLVLEAASLDEARGLLADLPMTRAGLISFETLALGAFMGFDSLMEGGLDG